MSPVSVDASRSCAHGQCQLLQRGAAVQHPLMPGRRRASHVSLMELLLAQRRINHLEALSKHNATAAAWGRVMLCRQQKHPHRVTSEWRCGREYLTLSAGVAEERRRPHSGETSGAEREVAWRGRVVLCDGRDVDVPHPEATAFGLAGCSTTGLLATVVAAVCPFSSVRGHGR
ncbi:hypothetical protein TcG_05737 [Trypanosoma cruzi]|nr:hypothetical protein TcG_05737 [Trypanosoma cruzi]